MTEYERVKEKMTLLSKQCYSQELSACPKHPIFQVQKFINLILAIDGICIKADDPSLPEDPYTYRSKHSPTPNENLENGCSIGFSRAVDDMLKAGFVKCLPKEK